MEREADNLIMENISKNMSDADEYPAMMQMHARCISIIANLWGAQKGEKPIGTATTGKLLPDEFNLVHLIVWQARPRLSTWVDWP